MSLALGANAPVLGNPGAGAVREIYFGQIADAIYWTEGDIRARQAYGIETIDCFGHDDCRKIALNTIRNNFTRWQNSDQSISYLDFLARRYCPPNSKVWLQNVRYFLDNPKEIQL